MTLSATYEPRRQQGNGITKEFSYSFDPYSLEALRVYIEENGVQTETQDYTATANENGGIVTFNVAPTSEQYVVIARSVPQDQEVPFYTSSGFDAGVVENSLDKLTAMVQEVNNEAVRSAKLPKGYNINLELPVPESGKGLYWNNEGTGFQNSRLNLDDVETLTKSYKDQSLAARDEAVASSTRAVNTVKEATDLLANTQAYVEEAVVTIDAAVNDAKTTITETSEEAKETINGYVSNAEDNVRQIAQEEANKAIEDAAAAATEIAINSIQPLVGEVTEKSGLAIESASLARTWATGSDDEVQVIEPDEHSSRTYANFSMALANAPEDVPVLESTLLATDVVKGPKGDSGDAEFSGDVEFEGSFNVHGDDNHPVKVTSLAGASASGFQVVDSNGAGESDFEHAATGDRYITRIANKSTATSKTVNVDLYQTTAGKSVLDAAAVDTVLVKDLQVDGADVVKTSGDQTISGTKTFSVSPICPTPATSDNSTKTATTAWVNSRECTTAATTTSSASKTKPAVIVQNYVNGNNWYRVWSDGWIEQGGMNAKDNTTVNLLKPFKNTNYGLICALDYGTGSPSWNEFTSGKTNNSRTTTSFTTGTRVGNWYAYGY